jgi:hypothetical protein
MTNDAAVRDMLARLLGWKDAHAGFEAAVADIPAHLRGRQAAGVPYSLWQLVEHMRLAQADILDFCRNPSYHEKKWPDDYWPTSPEPPSPQAWDESIRRFQADRKALQELATDPGVDLNARIPHGAGQTYLREIVLVADHNAYHIGQIVLVRRLLGAWNA